MFSGIRGAAKQLFRCGEVLFTLVPAPGESRGVSSDVFQDRGLTGTAMGYATHFRTAHDTLEYRLTWAGVTLWAVFVAVTVGNFALAGSLGANLADATGLIVLSFGVNPLTAIAVVRHRAGQR